MFTWARTDPNGYEVSTRGNREFSALNARMSDNRTIEMWYQCDIKGYDPKGVDWNKGKGKPPVYSYSGDTLYELYLGLWRLHALQEPRKFTQLHGLLVRENITVLTDMFAHTPINQARAIAQLLNEWF